jgi:D-glycero-D-manno-heptose 1,7-bisphosphate phosphatase
MDEVDYCRRPEDVRAISGVEHALTDLRKRGWLAILITNQSGIGRGKIAPEEYQAVHSELLRQIGNQLDAAYFCPDAPPTDSKRRKPEAGMIFEAMADFDIDSARSWMVGDKVADIQCGQAAGVRTALVRTGYGTDYIGPEPDFVADNVVSAIHLILDATLDIG